MITFSKNILEKFPSEKELLLSVLQKWCDGNQVELIADFNANTENLIEIETNFSDKKIFMDKNFAEKIDGSSITLVGTKWILGQNENILTRCGCGKSFSFRSGNEAKDKIAILKAKLRKKPAHE